MVARLWRVRDRTTFLDLRARGRRGRGGAVQVTWVPAAAGDPPRVAFAVGRRVGSSVVRNRLRRRLRHLLADEAADLRPGAYLVAAGPTAVGLDTDELRAQLHRALEDAGARLAARSAT